MTMINKLRTVLIVDDDHTTNYLNERIVRELEIAEKVIVLHNGKEALQYLQQHCDQKEKTECPELIILDHHMPVMDGLDLMQIINENGMINNLDTVFLLLAIQTGTADLTRFKELGVQEFTPKPLSKDRLMEAYHKYWNGNTPEDQV